MIDTKEAKRESALARRAWPMLLVGAVIVAIGVAVSENVGGVLIGLFNLTGLVLLLLGLVGLVVGFVGRRAG